MFRFQAKWDIQNGRRLWLRRGRWRQTDRFGAGSRYRRGTLLLWGSTVTSTSPDVDIRLLLLYSTCGNCQLVCWWTCQAGDSPLCPVCPVVKQRDDPPPVPLPTTQWTLNKQPDQEAGGRRRRRRQGANGPWLVSHHVMMGQQWAARHPTAINLSHGVSVGWSSRRTGGQRLRPEGARGLGRGSGPVLSQKSHGGLLAGLCGGKGLLNLSQASS
jgi:hypothetical protein